MPAPIPPEIRRRALELTRAGHSSRTVVALLAKEGIKISYVTVTTIAKQAAGSPSVPTASAPSARSAPKHRPLDDDGPPDLTSVDPAAVADMDLVQLVTLGGLLQTAMTTAIKNEDARAAGQMWALREKVSLAIVRARPPTPPDPAKDPANTAAREEMRQRLQRLVLSARKSGAGLELLRAHLQVAEEAAGTIEAEAAE